VKEHSKVPDLSDAVKSLNLDVEALREASENHEERITELELRANALDEDILTVKDEQNQIKELF
jgi:hypothetical protein